MNVHPQFSTLHIQPESTDPLPNRLLPPETTILSSERRELHCKTSHRALSKLRARMQFTVDEDQVLVLRRVLVSAAGLYLKDLKINAIKSKHIAKIAIDIEASVVDHIIQTVIRNMQQVELGQISLL